jgi:hypothetical protein
MAKNIKLLERLYFLFLIILLASVALTPYIIKGGVSFFEEEHIEVILIVVQMIIGYFIFRLYKREVEINTEKLQRLQNHKVSLESQLNDAFKYIGSVNVQMQEIKSIFSGIKKYPENKKDFKYVMQFLADRVLGIADIEWVIFRIIDHRNFRSLKEYCGSRDPSVLIKCEINNEDLVKDKLDSYAVFKSEQKNFNVKAYCVISKKILTKDQQDFIKAIANQLEMMFIIFTSSYYENKQITDNIK